MSCTIRVVGVNIVSFVAASSNSGKTTLIEKVVRILKTRGLRVAVIKHTSGGFELDRPGKDSWRFEQAGADSVVIAGAGRIALIRRMEGEPLLDDLIRVAGDTDIVICEGFKTNSINMIEVYRSGVSGPRPLCLNNTSYLALVSDRQFPATMPQFNLNDAEGVADFITSDRCGAR
jgi:molybdopterin-guanine dinucleotide biosynthesis protein B